LVAAALLSRLGPVRGMPLFGYAASFATIAGASLLVPAVLFWVARMTRPWLRRLLGVEGLLAHASLASAIPRLSISVAALSVSLSMMVAIAVMIGSFRETVNYWIGQTLQADLFISPGVRPTPSSIQTVSSDVIALVQSHPDVAATDDFRNVESSYRGQLIVLGSGNYRIVLRHGSLVFKAPANARDALLAAVGTDNVAVSEPFANRFNHAVGDTITLDTREGPRPFRIAVIYYDYSNDRGTVVLDRATFERHFGNVPATGLTAYVREGVDPEAVRTSILGQLGDSRRIFLYTNRLLRAEVLRIFDSTFAITYALEVIAIVVAMLGVAGTLLTLVLERRRELSLLRLVGASRRQVLRMVVVEAGLIGAVSQIIGLAVGFLLSLILIYVINVQSFGWTIQFHLPTAFLMQATLAVIIGTALSGLYPARRAAAFATVREE
jgi:putative ABC transport system permease protein